jgi:hypothetical protein
MKKQLVLHFLYKNGSDFSYLRKKRWVAIQTKKILASFHLNSYISKMQAKWMFKKMI